MYVTFFLCANYKLHLCFVGSNMTILYYNQQQHHHTTSTLKLSTLIGFLPSNITITINIVVTQE